jgi:hypothetical protein
MGYADHLRSTSVPQRPNCWGYERSYDPNDVECGECRFRHSCRAEVERNSGSYSVPVRPSPAPATGNSYRRREREDVDAGNYEPATMQQQEKPYERFAKDAVGGALRGMFYEMWQFWKNYRIR